MNCYKLKKVYPFSPPLGTEIMYNGKYWICNKPIQGYSQFNKHISEFNPQDYPEFWEKVVEKDYEILSFTNHTKQITTKRKNGLFLNSICTNSSGVYTEEHHISKWDIHSIKRLSDGAIFSIGESINTNFSYGDFTNTIDSFTLDSNNKLIITTFIKGKYNTGKHPVRLKNLKKIKTPLFKTEDGVDIYEGDLMFYVYTGNAKCNKGLLYTIKKINADKHLNYCVVTEGKYFSNKEAAEEYILINKPCLSIKEIAPIFGMYHLDNSKTSLDRLSEKLKELVKGRI